MKKRIVVTGFGVMNALGKEKKEVEDGLFQGKSGLVPKPFLSKNGEILGTIGEVKDTKEEDRFFLENKLPYDKCIQLALKTAEECIKHSDIHLEEEDSYRIGVAIGTSLGGMLSGQVFHEQWLKKGIENADENYLLAYPLHAVADVIAKKYSLKGIKGVISTACAASGNIIGFGMDMIKSGKYDALLVGGVDPISTFSFAGFNALKALDPTPCKPYSESQGINLGEGSAFLLIEDLEHAKKRKAKVYSEILGYALSADAYHPTAPDLGGGGASRAMIAAIRQSGLKINDISYVNGHGTGTVANDNAERSAFKAVFGKESEVALSSIKGAIGHCLGAAGAQECIASIMAINRGEIPPTVNFKAENTSNINLVENIAQKKNCDVILSNSFAFGGNNCCLAIGKKGAYEKRVNEENVKRSEEKVVITGYGCCGVGGTNIKELFETFNNRKVCITNRQIKDAICNKTGEMPDVEWKKYIPSKFIRRIDEVTKLTMTAGKQALDSAKIKVTKNNMERIGVVYATGTGPLSTIVDINKKIIEKGINSIDLSDFPNSVINAAPGNFCIANMLKGSTSTLSGGMMSFMLAFNYSIELLKNEAADAIVVISADECNDPLIVGNDKVKLLARDEFAPLSCNGSGMVLSPGSVAVVLELEKNAKKRDISILAKVKGYHFTADNQGIATVSDSGEELAVCTEKALLESGLTSVNLLVNAGIGVRECDNAEINAISKLKKRGFVTEETAMSMVSPMLGVASGSNSGYGLLDILYSFEKNEVIGLPSSENALREEIIDSYLTGENMKKSIKTACLNSISLGGAYSSLVLEK